MERSNQATSDKIDANNQQNNLSESSSSRLFDDALSSMQAKKCLSKLDCGGPYPEDKPYYPDKPLPETKWPEIKMPEIKIPEIKAPEKPFPGDAIVKPKPESRDTCVERANGDIACGTELSPENLRDRLRKQKIVDALSTLKDKLKLPSLTLE